MFSTKREIGFRAEQQAEKYLNTQGLKTILQNFQCRVGEIDLIMQDREILVFVEVRYRQQTHYGSGTDSVDYFKQKKLIKTAKYYLQKQHLWEKMACRFDVVDVSGINKFEINWIKDAFWLK